MSKLSGSSFCVVFNFLIIYLYDERIVSTMTNHLELTPRLNKARMSQQLYDRVDGCKTANCWIIKDPIDTNKVIWLREKEYYHPQKISGKQIKGRLVLIKRLLYCLEYDEMPSKHVKNYCEEKNCVNPSHCYVPGGTKRSIGMVHQQIDNNVLTVTDARKWGLFNDL